MNPQALLAQLHDAHAPGTIGLWPLAPGWWAVILLALALLSGLSFWLVRRHRRSAYRREAQALLNQQYQRYQEDGDAQAFLQQANQLLRRLALHCLGREHSAASTGGAWLAQLNSLLGEPLSPAVGEALSQGVYQRHLQADIDAVHQELVRFIRQHRHPQHQRSSRV